MPQYTINLKAGKATRQNFSAAKYLNIADLGAASSVDVDIEIEGFSKESLVGLRARDQVQTPGFSSASFTAAVDCQIQVIATVADVRLNNSEGQAVNASIIGTVPVNVAGPNPLPVSIAGPNPLPVVTSRGGAPASPLYVSGAVLGDTPAATLVDNAAAAAGPALVGVLGADATRLEAIFYNIGPDPVALGMAGLTWAKRAIVLQAGDCWIEARGASQAWYAITDAAKAASVTVQERKA